MSATKDLPIVENSVKPAVEFCIINKKQKTFLHSLITLRSD